MAMLTRSAGNRSQQDGEPRATREPVGQPASARDD